MARTVAELPKGARITDHISLGVLTKTFPLDKVTAAVAAAGKTSQRQRDLPAHVVVYYVMALTLYMQVSYREVLRTSAYPQVRFVSLVENGTHVLFGTQMSGYGDGEITLAHKVLPSFKKGMLCLADRNFFGFDLWKKACATGADLLWRVKKNLRLPCEKRLSDGSYLSTIYRTDKDRRRGTNGIRVRVIEYILDGVAGAEPIYRLLTSILDPDQAPVEELAALYHERWEIETALDELKTHLRGSKIVLRSKTPDLVRQEFYGLMMTHFAVRGLMHEAALKAGEDPDRLSFLHAVRVVRRKLPHFVAIPPSAEKSVS